MDSSTTLTPVQTDSLFDDLDVSVEELPFVAPGDDYDVICLSCRKTRKFDRDVLLFRFQIVSPGPGFNVILETYINKPVGRTIPARAKLGSWMRLMHAYDPTVSLRRLSLKLFKQFQFKASIETVTRDRNRRILRDHDQFSKIGDLTAIVGKRG